MTKWEFLEAFLLSDNDTQKQIEILLIHDESMAAVPDQDENHESSS